MNELTEMSFRSNSVDATSYWTRVSGFDIGYRASVSFAAFLKYKFYERRMASLKSNFSLLHPKVHVEKHNLDEYSNLKEINRFCLDKLVANALFMAFHWL